MQNKDNVMNKASFYIANRIKCHIKIIPSGFKNGFIISELINNTFFWFVDDRNPNNKQRLFLSEILDIGDYINKDKVHK